VAKYAVEMSKRLVKDHEVHVLCSQVGVEVDDVIIHRVPIPWWPYYLRIGSNAVKNTYYARKLKKRLGVDVVHSQGAESLYQDVVKAPSCHRAAIDQLKKERGLVYKLVKPFEPASKIVLAIEKYNYVNRNFKKAIVLSHGTYRELQEYYGVPDECLAHIPNGVDVDEYCPTNRDKYLDDVRGRHGLSKDDFVLLFVGWEFKRKGLRYVVDALAHLSDEYKLIVVGGDNKAPYVEQAKRLGVGDRVVFAGPSKSSYEYYGAADLFVFPTSYESFSMATLEAVSSGLPILASSVNGTEELIEDGVNGFFIQKDGKDIAEKVLLSVERGLSKMGAKARKSALPYSWDNIAKLTANLYEEIV